MAPIGGGLALVESLGRYVDENFEKITVFYETAARELITGDNGMEAFRVEKIGSSVDKMAALRGC